MIQATTTRQIRDPSEGWLACIGWVQSGDVQTAEACCLYLAAATRGLCCWCGSAPYAVFKVQKEREPLRSFLLLSYMIVDFDRI
jgi:hypothetical protein